MEDSNQTQNSGKDERLLMQIIEYFPFALHFNYPDYDYLPKTQEETKLNLIRLRVEIQHHSLPLRYVETRTVNDDATEVLHMIFDNMYDVLKMRIAHLIVYGEAACVTKIHYSIYGDVLHEEIIYVGGYDAERKCFYTKDRHDNLFYPPDTIIPTLLTASRSDDKPITSMF